MFLPSLYSIAVDRLILLQRDERRRTTARCSYQQDRSDRKFNLTEPLLGEIAQREICRILLCFERVNGSPVSAGFAIKRFFLFLLQGGVLKQTDIPQTLLQAWARLRFRQHGLPQKPAQSSQHFRRRPSRPRRIIRNTADLFHGFNIFLFINTYIL